MGLLHGALGMRGRVGVALLLGVAFLAPGGCALFFKAPEVRIVGVEVVALGLTSGTAELTLEVTNRGRRDMSIRGLGYRLEVRDPKSEESWSSLAEGFFPDEVLLPGRESRKVTLPVPFQYEALGAALRSFLASGEVPYRVSGDVRVGGSGMAVQIPFRSDGVLKPR
jgi:LEA14-like dessication related protein